MGSVEIVKKLVDSDRFQDVPPKTLERAFTEAVRLGLYQEEHSKIVEILRNSSRHAELREECHT